MAFFVRKSPVALAVVESRRVRGKPRLHHLAYIHVAAGAVPPGRVERAVGLKLLDKDIADTEKGVIRRREQVAASGVRAQKCLVEQPWTGTWWSSDSPVSEVRSFLRRLEDRTLRDRIRAALLGLAEARCPALQEALKQVEQRKGAEAAAAAHARVRRGLVAQTVDFVVTERFVAPLRTYVMAREDAQRVRRETVKLEKRLARLLGARGKLAQDRANDRQPAASASVV